MSKMWAPLRGQNLSPNHLCSRYLVIRIQSRTSSLLQRKSQQVETKLGRVASQGEMDMRFPLSYSLIINHQSIQTPLMCI